MLLLIFVVFISFASANRHRSVRTSKEAAIATAKEYLAENLVSSPAIEVNATQLVLDRMQAQIDAMAAGPKKVAAQNAFNHFHQHASRNVERTEKKAQRIIGKRTIPGMQGTNLREQMLNPPSENKNVAEIADLDIKLVALQNSTVMEEYKASMHAAAMEKIEGARKRKRFVKTIKK